MSDSLARLSAALADRYANLREVGSGGMATVYLAEDLKHRRKVALKVLRPELAASLGGGDRFFREIEIAAQLQHPHILPLLDSGEAGGFLFYVMPYVDGQSLRERLAQKGELPVTEAVRILCEVVDALAHAHRRGVVHRDIKPDNVLLSERHAMVMDFGVAKALADSQHPEGPQGRRDPFPLTTAGIALGTPSYMAPEQASADPHLDHRVDLYAVGVLGYELLTGQPPFTGRSSQEVLAAHVTQAPVPISSRRPNVSPALEAVLMRCLEKRPADRWQSADELLAQLEPLATPSGGFSPAGARSAGKSFPESPRPLLGRANFASSMGAYDSARGYLLAVARTHPGLSQQQEVSNQLLAVSLVQGKLAEAERSGDELLGLAEKRGLPADYLETGAALGLVQALYRNDPAAGLKTVEAALKRHPLASLAPINRPYSALASFYAKAGQADRARQLLAEYQSAVPASYRRRDVNRYRAAGDIGMAEGKAEEALTNYHAWRDSAACTNCALYELGRAYELAKQPDSALVAYQQAVSNPGGLGRVFGDAWTLAATYRRLGELHEERGDREKAIDSYGKFIDLWKQADPELQPQVRQIKERLAKLVGEKR